MWSGLRGFHFHQKHPAQDQERARHARARKAFRPLSSHEVTHANIGSSVKISAVRVDVVYCCAQACIVKASAVASRPVIRTALQTAGRETSARRLRPPEQAQRQHGRNAHLCQSQQFETRFRRNSGPTSRCGPAKATAQTSVSRSPVPIVSVAPSSVISPMPASRSATPASSTARGLILIDERGEQRYHHRRKSGDEGRFGRRGQPQPEGLEGVAGEQERPRRSLRRARQRLGAGCASLRRKRNSSASAAREKRSARNSSGRDVLQRLLDHHEGGAPDQGVEDQRQVGAGARSPAALAGGGASRSRSSRASVSRMRFRPRSRPSGLNHSWGVWAPPPWPPAPMETAGNPEEQGDVGVGRGAVQARADAQVGVHGAHIREDGGVLGQRRRRPRADLPDLGAPPCRRWRAGSPAPAPGRWRRSATSTSSSILSLLSERMSTLARACAGMALMPVPPSINPTLMEDLGGAVQPRIREQRHRAAERVDGVADAVIAPTVAARAA